MLSRAAPRWRWTRRDRAGRPRGSASATVGAPTRPPVDDDLRSAIAAFRATFGAGWGPVTARKHADDFARFLAWLEATDRPATIGSLDLVTLAAYVADLRTRPKVQGVWRGSGDALARAVALGPSATLSANSINAYMRPLRSLVIWLVDEGRLRTNPFRTARRHAARNPLLPAEETPPKGASLDDLRALDRGCAGETTLDLRDRAIVALLTTTAARNSSIRLLRLDDVDLERDRIVFRRAKGAKTLVVALHPLARQAIVTYLDRGRAGLVRPADDAGWLFPAAHGHGRPLNANGLSLMLRRRYRAGGGTLPTFGSHRIRHATATLLANNGMGLEEVSRYLGHSSTLVTRRYAQQTPDMLGERAARALARAGLTEAAEPA
jgi:integrase/recombinase XerC